MKHNESIKCTVEKCKHHCKEDDFCTLDSIMVGSHAMDPKNNEATDCNSFECSC
ncbi:DUF1540 domain-containing protein [Clostridium chrysemydis]|uniref:DUF1540 domain-containing protein n=1 Tax=Clostridium chrysemydis TaxID=2665504 RepID=UPI0018840B7B|nr:DUF1540 domain-containing protein [Clostridium chrysemydis]